MRLLILTQKIDINDDILGFFHSWVAEFAKHCERLTVIALNVGEYHLPNNVKVLSLGKESLGFGIWDLGFLKKLKYSFNFFSHIWHERKNYDYVFVHMNSEYVMLGGWLWRFLGKKIFMWYTHKQVDLKLHLAVWLVHGIFTASPASFRLPTRKLLIMGHGIDVENFKIRRPKLEDKEFKIVSNGRISPVKRYEELIEAVKLIVAEKKLSAILVEIIGGPGTLGQADYLEKLKKMIADYDLDQSIRFIGSIPHNKVAEKLASADVFAHMSQTGSLDKAMLEAMAVGLPVISCNDSAVEIFADKFPELLYPPGDSRELARRLSAIYDMSLVDRNQLGQKLRQVVVEKHSLDILIKNLVKNMSYGK